MLRASKQVVEEGALRDRAAIQQEREEDRSCLLCLFYVSEVIIGRPFSSGHRKKFP